MQDDSSPSDKEVSSESTPFLKSDCEDNKTLNTNSPETSKSSQASCTDKTVELSSNHPDQSSLQSSPYSARASIMRSKIEEKITEIERKMQMPSLDISTESLDVYNGPADYNLITVMDASRSRSYSVSEMRQNTIDRLQSKLEKAEKDLELREEEVSRLRKIRNEVGFEIEDLTASLFEEANNMVRNAGVKQQKAEKKFKEVNMKLSMLQDEVIALKTIVQSVKPSCSSDNTDTKSVKSNEFQRETYEVDPIFNDEFVKWRQDPSLDKNTLFMKRIYDEDISSCLNFKNSELSCQVLAAIEDDKITIENMTASKTNPLPKFCALMNAPRLCPYKMYLNGEYYSISTLSRNRITAICDLFCYLRYIQQGLITLRIHEVYLEVLKKRRRIASAKLGLTDDIVE